MSHVNAQGQKPPYDGEALERYSEPLTPHPESPGGQLGLQSTLGGKATGPGRNESQRFHHRSTLQPLPGLLLRSWEPAFSHSQAALPTSARRPGRLILHPHPPPRMPWDFLKPSGPTHTPNWGIPNDELSPLSLSFPVLRMRSVTSTFEGSSMRPGESARQPASHPLLLSIFTDLFTFGHAGSLLLRRGSSLQCAGCSLRGLLLLPTRALGHVGFGSCGSQALELSLSSRGTQA